MNEQEVKELLSKSWSSSEWRDNCNLVKKECDGYPAWWYEKIILSGFADSILQRWGSDTKIRMVG